LFKIFKIEVFSSDVWVTTSGQDEEGKLCMMSFTWREFQNVPGAQELMDNLDSALLHLVDFFSEMLHRYRVDGDVVSGDHIILFRWPQAEDHLPFQAYPFIFVICALLLGS
jgi:hypothetical protein